MADGPGRMIFLGFGKYARADKIYAVEPIVGKDRGGGHRTRVWIEGVPDPIIAGRTERTILHDMGQDAAIGAPIIDEALKLAERIVDDADKGRVDLNDLGRRARRLLEKTSRPATTNSSSERTSVVPSRRARPPRADRGRHPAASQLTGLPPPVVRHGHLGDRKPDHDGRDSVSALRGDGLDPARRPARDRRARPTPDRPDLRRGGCGCRRPPANAAPLGHRAAGGDVRAARELTAARPQIWALYRGRGARHRGVRLPAAGAERAHAAARRRGSTARGDCGRGRRLHAGPRRRAGARREC